MVLTKGSVSYEIAKVLTRITKHLVGKSTHHTNNTQDSIEQLKNVHLERGDCITSHDATAVFTSVSVDPALYIIK